MRLTFVYDSTNKQKSKRNGMLQLKLYACKCGCVHIACATIRRCSDCTRLTCVNRAYGNRASVLKLMCWIEQTDSNRHIKDIAAITDKKTQHVSHPRFLRWRRTALCSYTLSSVQKNDQPIPVHNSRLYTAQQISRRDITINRHGKYLVETKIHLRKSRHVTFNCDHWHATKRIHSEYLLVWKWKKV